MEGGFFHTVFYEPLYNALIFFVDVIPGADAGIAVIVLTVLVKLCLFPFSQKATRTQLVMKRLEGKVNALKEQYKDKREEQARQILALYREHKVNPFSSFFLILLQLPIIFALYAIFFKGGLPVVDADSLYGFISVPENVSMEFLGLVNIAQKSLALALLTGITQFFQARLSIPLPEKRKEGAEPSLREDFARSMQLQFRYVFPVIAFFISWSISGAVALYWTTSNLFAIGQELYLRKKLQGEK